MKHMLYIAGALSALSSLAIPVQAAPQVSPAVEQESVNEGEPWFLKEDEPEEEQQTPATTPQSGEHSAAAQHALSVGRDMLQTTNDLWFLMAGVCNRETADQAALPFAQLATKLLELDSALTAACMEYEVLISPESEKLMNLRLGYAFEDMMEEFTSLCRARCYESPGLMRAFRAAIDTGMFPDEALTYLQDVPPPLNAQDERLELSRLKRLLEPDQAVLETLREVQDVQSAQQAVGKLEQISRTLRGLRPDRDLANRDFADKRAQDVIAARRPLEMVLWKIRSEIVRIASLPGYDSEPYDDFSDVLDVVFESLGQTHRAWFYDVFDSSFRVDLTDALQEGSPNP